MVDHAVPPDVSFRENFRYYMDLIHERMHVLVRRTSEEGVSLSAADRIGFSPPPVASESRNRSSGSACRINRSETPRLRGPLTEVARIAAVDRSPPF